MKTLGTIIADFTTALSTAISVGGTTATIQSITDDDGNTIPNGRYFFTIDGSNSQKEHFVCELSGNSLTAMQSVSRQGVKTTGAARIHRVGATVSITDYAHIKVINDLLDGTTGINYLVPLYYDGLPTFNDPAQIPTKDYVDTMVNGGTVSYQRLVQDGNAGEVVTIGDLIYLKNSDGRWYKIDADVTATFQNVMVGIAQGAGTIGNPISGGVLVFGLDTNQSGGSAGSIGYAQNTPGDIGINPGTNTFRVGVFKSSTLFYFNPYYYNNLTQAQIDALQAGGSMGSPSSSNKFITQQGLFGGGTGADGALNVASGTTTLNDASKVVGDYAIYNYTTIDIASGAVLTTGANLKNKILVLLATGAVNVAGTINRSSQGGNGGAIGAVGTKGAGAWNVAPQPGISAITPGQAGGLASAVGYLNVACGDGGAGGFSKFYVGGAGGSGGGAVIIVSNGAVNLNGMTLNLSGGNGVSAGTEPVHNYLDGNGGSGGGAGGAGQALFMGRSFTTITVPYTLTLTGGTPGDGSVPAGVSGGSPPAQVAASGPGGGASGETAGGTGQPGGTANSPSGAQGRGGTGAAGRFSTYIINGLTPTMFNF